MHCARKSKSRKRNITVRKQSSVASKRVLVTLRGRPYAICCEEDLAICEHQNNINPRTAWAGLLWRLLFVYRFVHHFEVLLSIHIHAFIDASIIATHHVPIRHLATARLIHETRVWTWGSLRSQDFLPFESNGMSP